MNCLYCEKELKYHDWYGTNMPLGEHSSRVPNKRGDIYKCENEECDQYEGFFYTKNGDELFEGYPC